MTYQVVLDDRVREQLRVAPAELRGYVSGVVAVLRTDPAGGTFAFTIIGGPDYKRVVFPDTQGFLDFRVFEDKRLIVLVDLSWPP